MSNAQELETQLSPLMTGTIFTWNFNGKYANKLVADLSEDQMVYQPGMGMNHPAWVLSHLNTYHPVVLAMLRGETPTDPLNAPFGQKSKPVADRSAYADKASLIAQFNQGHEDIAAALGEVDDATLARPIPVERWQKNFPTVGASLGYLLLYHESTHLGQVSAWRRVQGLASV